MDGSIKFFEMLGFVLQINDLLLKIESLLDEGDPCPLRERAPAAVQQGMSRARA